MISACELNLRAARRLLLRRERLSTSKRTSARRRGVTEFGRNVRNNVGDQPVRLRITWRKVRLTGIG
jgi:hypothetical protein